MRFVLLFICGLLLVSSCKKDKINVEDDLPYLNFNFSTGNESLMKGTPKNDMSNYDSVSVLLYSYNDTEDYNPTNLPSTFTSYGKVKLNNADGTGTAWNYAPPKFWSANRKLAFFAYSSDMSLEDGGITTTKYQSGIPVLTYSVPTDVKKQPDLLVSTPVVDMTKESNDGSNKIKLSMNHALSCISFAPISNLERKIEKIEIKNVYGTADLNMSSIPSGVKYPQIKWENYRDKTITFSAGIDPNVNIPRDLPSNNLSYLMNSDGYLMMIPQVLNGAKIVVKYSDEVTPIEINIPTMEWEAGKKYIYSWGSGGVVTYYEIYADNNIGFYYYDIDGTLINSIRDLPDVDNAGIVEAGYGVLSYGPVAVKLKWGDSEIDGVNAMFGVNAKVGGMDFYLYPVSQTAIAGGNKGPFNLMPTNIPEKMYINGEPTYGYCLPHFAKGVYLYQPYLYEHHIRTPQQMINISVNTHFNGSINFTTGGGFYQENHLSFSEAHAKIGGKNVYNTSIVNSPGQNDSFMGTYYGENRAIKSMVINSTDKQCGLFKYVGTYGLIRELTVESTCSVTVTNFDLDLASGVGGIAGKSSGQLRGLKSYADVYAPERRNAGGICGYMDFPSYAVMEDCHCYNINVTSKISAGGILGACDAFGVYNPGQYIYIKKCTTNGGAVKTLGTDGSPNGTGGICGMIPAYGTSVLIENCANFGTSVEGQSSVGGILGMASIAISWNGVTGGKIELSSCAVYNASVRGHGIGFNTGVGGVVGVAFGLNGSSGNILLDDMLYVNSSNNCQVTSSHAVSGINPSNIYVGGIIGDAYNVEAVTHADTKIRDCIYIGVAPIGDYKGTNTLYPIIGDDTGAIFDGKYYYLQATSYNDTPTRYSLAKGFTTAEFADDMTRIYGGSAPIKIIGLDPSRWQSVYTGNGTYPYPKLKDVAIPTGTGWWPVVNDGKRTLK